MTTIREVAALARVSVGTVSNVLNRPDRVAPGTRETVEDAIRTLGFVPDGSARQLRARESPVVGLVVLDVGNPFFTDVARGVEDAANEAGCVVVMCNSDDDRAKEDRYLRALEEMRVRGVLVTPVPGAGGALRRLRERGIAVVLLDRPGPRGQCSVAVDDVLGGELAVTHLLELGHRRIAYVHGPLSIRQCADRLAGSRRACERAGLDPGSVLVDVPVDDMRLSAGYAGGLALLDRPDRPTAAFCSNDLHAFGVLRACSQAGVPVPEGLAVVGYDDIDLAAETSVALTTVRQPRHELGRAAAELLLAEADPHSGHRHRRLLFDPELVVRASTAPPA